MAQTLTDEVESIMKDVILDLKSKGMTKKEIKNHVKSELVDAVFREFYKRNDTK